MTTIRTNRTWLFLFLCTFFLSFNAFSQKPKAVNDRYSTLKNIPLYFKPTLNDSLFGGKLLAVAIASPPTRGTIGFVTLDSLIYAPKFNECDYKDTLSYYLCNENFQCDTAKIFIDVLCRAIGSSTAPDANDDFISTRKNTSIIFKPTLNDSLNGETLTTLGLVQTPKRGSVGFKTRDSLIYVPQFNQCAYKDTLIYYICNERGLCDTAKIIADVSCATTFTNNPVAANDYIVTGKNTPIIFNPTTNDLINGRLIAVGLSAAPINGSLSFLTLDTLRYSPKQDFCGKDSLIYRVCNEKYQCDTGFVFFDVRCEPYTSTIVPVIVTFRLSLDQVQNAPVHIVGDFQKDAGFPQNWDATSMKMQGPTNGFYLFTDTVFNKVYQFKYLKNNTWQDASTAINYAESARFDLQGCGVLNGSGVANRLLDLSKITIPYQRVLISQDWNNCSKGILSSYNVGVSATEGGKATGGGLFFPADSVTVRASANAGFKFVKWTEGTVTVSSDSIFKFILGTASRDLVANFSRVSALKELPNNTFEAYPNPTSGRFTIVLNPDNVLKIKELSVKDILGRTILLRRSPDGKGVFSENDTQLNLDLSYHAKGLYFIHLKTADGELTKKIIVK